MYNYIVSLLSKKNHIHLTKKLEEDTKKRGLTI